MDYLSYEDQFKENLNQEEIERIEDQELRKVRTKYWQLKSEAFLNEQNISDDELAKVTAALIKEEQKEINRFRMNTYAINMDNCPKQDNILTQRQCSNCKFYGGFKLYNGIPCIYCSYHS